MSLVDWIQANLAEVLEAWEHNARVILASEDVSKEARRDHAESMLRRVMADMGQPQSQRKQTRRAVGLTSEHPGVSSAQQHGAARMRLGMSAVQVLMEFRALRMSVLQRWTDEASLEGRSNLENLVRFDQALDEAVTEALESFTQEKAKRERLFHTMLSSSPDASYILDTEGRFLHANRAATQLFNTDVERLVGSTLADLGIPLQDDFYDQLELVIRGRAPLRGELTLMDKAGRPLGYEYIYTPVFDDQDRVEAVLATARDVTQRRESEAQIWRHANYDPLTELPNRRLFLDRLDEQTKRSERSHAPFALFFIDLDHFKEVNDLVGHDGGDLLLKQAAERIRSCVRQTDTVARLGGDEFTVMLLDTDDLVHIDQIAKDILSKLRKPFRLGHDVSHISGSIGITRHPHDGPTPRQLLKNADQAMYAAKKNGRDQSYSFAQIMAQAAEARAQLAAELRGAVQQQEQEQLQLHYQPIVDLADGHVVKAEALLRWAHPTEGLLLPAAFLDVAEETSLIGDIENWVFAEAATCSKRWGSLTESPFQVSLNLSSVHFSRKAQTTPWEGHLKKLGLPGNLITVEFQEKVFSQAKESLSDKMARFEEAGIALALDDYGTGHSSLACLKQFNISYLKIAPAFVRGGEKCRTIAKAIITMAHDLGLKVIAEGVETQAQRDWLKDAGCDYAQGFFFSEPVSRQVFEELINTVY